MLTHLRAEGFKSLLDVEVFFGPFTCLIGTNAAGKSNIFDAIRFLSLLAQYPIMEAVARLRESGAKSADPRALFTRFGGFCAPKLRIEVDMLVGSAVEDDFGVSAETTKSPLRYSVAFRLSDSETPHRLQLIEESLVPIPKAEATRTMGFEKSGAFTDSCIRGRRAKPYISTNGSEIGLHQDKRSGRLLKSPAERALRTKLNGVDTSEYPTALAAKQEMLSWQTLMLEPSAMRAPSTYRDPARINEHGEHLPAAVVRLQRGEANEGQVCAELANRLGELAEDVRYIQIIDDPKTETFTIEAQYGEGVYHPAQALSDGTLRFLVLSVLSIDPLAQGVICLEEPENGIHPGRTDAMVSLLRDIAVDPHLAAGPDNPLRQVIVNSHSPHVLDACSPSEIVYISSVETSIEGAVGHHTTLHVPPGSWRSHRPRQLDLVLGQLQPYRRRGEGQLWLQFQDNDG